MSIFLSRWYPKCKIAKFLKYVLIVVVIVLFFSFLILPFCNFSDKIMQICKWLWLGCAVINLDLFARYKEAKEKKLLYPISFLYIVLTLTYLYTYWQIVSLPIVICGSIVGGMIEFTVSVSIYKTIRFTDKQKLVELSPKMIQSVQLGGLYICALVLFVLGICESTVLLYIFGGIALILLAVSILLSLSNGLTAKKNVFALIVFAVDVLSFLALVIYLIYVIPEVFEKSAALQSIITTILAAVLGGALTLVGVAWTIKKADNDRRDEEKKKYRPIIVFYKTECEPDYTIKCEEFSLPNEVSFQNTNHCFSYKINDFVIRNLDFSSLYIEGLIINEKYVLYRTANLFVEKDKFIQFKFYPKILFTKFNVEKIGILVKDFLDNEYVFDLGINFEKKYLNTEISITGSKKLTEYKGEH